MPKISGKPLRMSVEASISVKLLNPSRPYPGRREKNFIKLNFKFSHFVKAFIKPFETPQRSVKIKI